MREPGRRTSAARFPRLGVIAVLAVAVATAGAPAASAATVTCGQAVATDVVLDNDLANCPGDGLVAAADGITVDLNGHTVAGVGGSSPDTVGVLLGDHPNVTVRNGRLRGFTYGVKMRHGFVFAGGGGDRVLEVALADVSVGVQLLNPGGNVIAFNTIAARATGVYADALGDEIAYNHFTGGGISLIGNGTRIEHNRVGVIALLVLSRGAFVADNSVNRITVLPLSSHATLVGNVVVGGGIEVQGSQTLVWRNRVIGSSTDGIVIHGGNDEFTQGVTASDDVVLGNIVGYSARDGIALPPAVCGRSCDLAAANALVRHNTVRHNGRDGIRAEAPSTTVTRNIARFNAGVGIFAAGGVTDGGGNVARGNGGGAQCVGIVCG